MGNTCKTIEIKIQAQQRYLNHKSTNSFCKLSTKDTMELISLVHTKKNDINEDYTLIKPPIGAGAYGSVYKAIQKLTGLQRAVKKINKNMIKPNKQDFQQFQILKCLDHPNIIKIFQIYESDQIYIVTELCTGGQLFQKIMQTKHFSQHIAANYMLQLFSAISYCHSHNIIHRDIKPQNILFQNNGENSLLKIIDFGASKIIRIDQKLKNRIGTIYYIAPEVLKRNYNTKCDLWSCGVILYIMLCGAPPFNGKNDKQILQKIQSGTVSFKQKIWLNVSQDAKDLIKKLLQIKPQKRISAYEALKHDWIVFNKKKANYNEFQFKQSIQNMKNFIKITKFQESIVIFIANYLTSSLQRQKIVNQFKQIDINGDGLISKCQFLTAYKKIYKKIDISQKQIEKIFDGIDSNGSGFIDYTQFVTSGIKTNLLINQKKLLQAFQMIDKDKNGRLSSEQLTQFLGDSISENIYSQISVQLQKSDQITKEYFLKIMMNILQKQQIHNNNKI